MKPNSTAPSLFQDRRLAREHRTIAAMIHIYCQKKHGSRRRQLCSECQEMLEYATVRLEKCPFGGEKSTCANCAVHCYRPDMRQRVREIMRFAGPYMMFRHPYLSFMHLVVDSRRPAPELSATRKKA